MEQQVIENLLEKYYEGKTSIAEEKILKEYFAEYGDIPPHLIHNQSWFKHLKESKEDMGISKDFENKLMNQIKRKPKIIKLKIKTVVSIISGVAASVALFIGGVYYGRSHQQIPMDEVAELKTEMKNLKETVILSQIKENSASERIKGVNTVVESKSNNEDVIDALINTLYTDENPNVRLTAANALFVYKDNEKVRKALLEGIDKQEDTSVKVVLMNMMIALKEKKAKPIIEDFLAKEPVPIRVKEIIQKELKKI